MYIKCIEQYTLVPERNENRTKICTYIAIPTMATLGAYFAFGFGGGGNGVSPFKEMDLLNASKY